MNNNEYMKIYQSVLCGDEIILYCVDIYNNTIHILQDGKINIDTEYSKILCGVYLEETQQNTYNIGKDYTGVMIYDDIGMMFENNSDNIIYHET